MIAWAIRKGILSPLSKRIRPRSGTDLGYTILAVFNICFTPAHLIHTQEVPRPPNTGENANFMPELPTAAPVVVLLRLISLIDTFEKYWNRVVARSQDWCVEIREFGTNQPLDEPLIWQ